MALLKISKAVIRVAERVLNLTGTPLPTTIAEQVQLTMESRAQRPWEEFDERIIRVGGRGEVAGVALEFAFLRLNTTTEEGTTDWPRGSIFVLDGARSESVAVQALFGWFDNASVAGILGLAVHGCKDNREAIFLAGSSMLPLQGTQVGAGTFSIHKRLVATFDQSQQPEEWGYIQRPIQAAAGGTVLGFRSTSVAEELQVRWWGRIILPN